MNLCEFPFASLRRTGDRRRSIVYEGWATDSNGERIKQKWTVRGDSELGLPNEFDERVYVAFMYLAGQQDFARRVEFSVYQILKTMGLRDDSASYRTVELSLDRLKGVTLKAEGAFWDNRKRELVRTIVSFNLIDKYWLRYREKDERVREEERAPAYIIWGEDIWQSFHSNNIKALDTGFFYSLQSPLARRLYRLLDKFLRERKEYEFDLFDLGAKLGMVRYRKPADTLGKMRPGIDELIARGFLGRFEVFKQGSYTRIRFYKPSVTSPSAMRASSTEEQTSVGHSLEAAPQTGSQGPTDPLAALLTQRGVSQRVAQHLVTKYPAERISQQVGYLDFLVASGQAPKSPAGYLRRSIEQDFAAPPGYQERDERQQKERALRQEQELRQAEELVEQAARLAVSPEERADRRLQALEAARRTIGRPPFAETERQERRAQLVEKMARETHEFFQTYPELALATAEA